MQLKKPFQMLGVVGAIALAATTVACSGLGGNGGSAVNPDDPTLAVYQPAADLVPEDIADSGVLKMAIPTNEPPTQFYREGTKEMTGINPDIARLIAGALGLELQIDVTNFDSIIPGIEADRFQMTVSSMTPTEERMKVLDFVEYMNVNDIIAVKKGNPHGVDFNDLCGKEVGFLIGSYQMTVEVPAINEECAANGKPDVIVQQFQDTTQAMGSLVSDRSHAVYADGPILAYAAVQNPDIEMGFQTEGDAVGVGIGLNTGLLPAVKEALDHVITTPEYKEVLAKYGVDALAITEAKVNVPQ